MPRPTKIGARDKRGKWKVTRNGENIYPGDTGTSKVDAMRHVKLFNKWAKMNGGKPTYGIRPVKK